MDSSSEWEQEPLVQRRASPKAAKVKATSKAKPKLKATRATAKAKTKGHSSSRFDIHIVDKEAEYAMLPLYNPHADMCRLPWSPRGWGSGPLRVASDCSGLGSFLYAMKSLGLHQPQDISLQFCSDIDEHCQAFIRHVHHPRLMYTDITNHVHHLAPELDL